jgi:hypothetical protein
MPDQIYIGPQKGLVNVKVPFNIDNNAFPTMVNFYTWRERAKRKRGTVFLGILQRQIQSVLAAPLKWQFGPIALVNGSVDLFVFLGLAPTPTAITGITQATQAVVTIVGNNFSIGQVVNITGVVGMTQINGGYYTIVNQAVNTITLNVNSIAFSPYISNGNAYLAGQQTIAPGTINLSLGGNLYTEPIPPDGTLLKNGVADPGSTINYATGVVTIAGGGVGPLTGTFGYFPGLPVMGLEDFVVSTDTSAFPVLLAFDTQYSYQINQNISPATFYNTTFFKSTGNPFVWSGNDFNQFWTINYSGALWATNNIPGFNFVVASFTSGSGTQNITFNFKSAGVNYKNLIIGDQIWFNEFIPPAATITNIVKSVSPTVVTSINSFVAGQKVTFTGVLGMTQLNQGIYTITVASPTSFSINVDSSAFGVYAGGGVANLDPSSATNTINGIVGTVSNNTDAVNGNYVVTFANAQTLTGTGIGQLLTNTIPGQDGIKWYDGDPTNTTGFPTTPTKGWVNFAPPLTATNVSINDTPTALYYLIGALAIVPFKDRLLFFSPWIGTSAGIQIQLIDTVIWSWNGTPYYTSLIPANQTFDQTAYYVDQTGKGGYLPAGISDPIATVTNNQDVLLVGFGGQGRKTRFVYTGNDFQPFLFFNINSELPSSATFSSVILDQGAIDLGTYGICMTNQQNARRIDLEIPDNVFQVQTANSGLQRINAIRDFTNEWIYFSYPFNNSQWKFPTQTFLLNYRDNTWAILYENYTRHGNYRAQNKFTWKTVPFPSWTAWREPWNSGVTSVLIPKIIAGNPEGYVLIQSTGVGEDRSGTISSLVNNAGNTQITSINHCVTDSNPLTMTGDYIQIRGVTGLLSSTITAITLGNPTIITSINTFSFDQFITITGVVGTTQLNNDSFQIISVSGTSITINVDSTNFNVYVSGGIATYSFNNVVGKVIQVVDKDNFVIDLSFPPVTYIGLGSFVRLSQPLLQTKQFPVYWEQGRQVRVSVQKYLLDRTSNGQITANIYLSQDPTTVWNGGSVTPVTNPAVDNSSLVYSQLVYTCPESTNLGLTPANINLQTVTSGNQSQIWHRMSTSLQGDSVQLGITLNDSQMRTIDFCFSEITLHAINLIVSPGPSLS